MPQRIAIFLVLAVCSAPLAADDGEQARAYLTEALRDPATTDEVLAALWATDDKDLAPLFESACRSGQKARRLVAVSALARLAGKQAAPVLLERLRKDSQMAVRAEALAHLVNLQAIPAARLTEALAIPDENIQCIAARALIQAGNVGAGVGILQRLADSKDLATASLARMSLLGTGQTEQVKGLRNVLDEPATPDDVVVLLMDQIAEEKIQQATELAGLVAASDRPLPVRLRAYRALSVVSPGGGEALRKPIRESSSTVFRVRLLKILAAAEGAQRHLKELAGGSDVVAVLARLELSRTSGGGRAARQAAAQAVATKHPIVVAYVLDAARNDIDARSPGAGIYTSALLLLVQDLGPGTAEPGPEQLQAARAATLLADLGTAEAIAGLRKILAGRYGAAQRAAAAGLLRTSNRAACDLVRPLLKSPYWQMASSAAMTLGRFGDRAAATRLREILAEKSKHSTRLVALACWFLLKIEGQPAQAAKALADAVQ